MSDAQRQLEQLLLDHVNWFDDDPEPGAAAVLAAGWRPPPRVVNSAEGLDALPVGSAIRALSDAVQGPHTWVSGGGGFWSNGVSIYRSKTIIRNYAKVRVVWTSPAEAVES